MVAFARFAKALIGIYEFTYSQLIKGVGKGRTGTCLVLTVLSVIPGLVWTVITAGMKFAIYGRGRLSEGTKDMIVKSLGTDFGGATENMKNGGISGHGFRQSIRQTSLSNHLI